MLSWWYSKGWIWSVKRIGVQIQAVGKVFAIEKLLKTWFSPWKQITTVAGSQTFIQKLVDNSISRIIGFIIRTFILLLASLWTSVSLVLGVLLVIVWPLLPASPVAFIVLYLGGVQPW